MEKNLYTKRWNKNRGYMNLEVWKKAIQLYKLIWNLTKNASGVDLKTKSQINDSALSVASNIAEGYSRRSVKEYLQYAYIALSSLSETLTRSIGLMETSVISNTQFESIDQLHYEIENKLIRLITSLEKKRDEKTWTNRIEEDNEIYHSKD